MMHERRFVPAGSLSSNPVTTPWRYVIAFVAVAFALGLAIDPMWGLAIATATTTVLAIGFTAKDLAGPLAAGMFLAVDRPFKVGDRVSVSGVSGQITSIGLLSIRIVTLEDEVVTIDNHDFLAGVVGSKEWAAIDVQIQTDFFLPIDEDPTFARRVAEEALTSCRYADTAKPWSVVAHQVLHDHVLAHRIRVRAHLADVRFTEAFEIDLGRRIARLRADHPKAGDPESGKVATASAA